jgi:hypothetical protein
VLQFTFLVVSEHGESRPNSEFVLQPAHIFLLLTLLLHYEIPKPSVTPNSRVTANVQVLRKTT